MGVCENCGNQYEGSFKIQMNGKAHEVDCFECAINLLAPTCGHCETRIIGHGVQSGGEIFCCAHCARAEGHQQLRDNTSASSSESQVVL